MEATAPVLPGSSRSLKDISSRWQLGLLGAVSIVAGADVAVLAATFKALENDLGLSPWTLGIIVMVQAVSMNVASPVWGWLCDEGFASRRSLMTLGCVGWGMSMAFVATSMGLTQMLLGRAANGLFLGLLVPLSQSAVAELVDPDEYGRVFGILESSRSFGGVVAGSITAAVSQEIVFGQTGWRLVCGLVGLASCILGAVLGAMGKDLRASNSHSANKSLKSIKDIEVGIGKILGNLYEHTRIKTFNVIVVQGIFGSIPWAVMSFEFMWLQYQGFSNTVVAWMVLVTGLFGAVGPAIGGAIGDYMETMNKDHGRVLTGQLSVFCGIPLTIAFLVILPKAYGASTAIPYILCKVLFHLSATWCSAAVNRPMLCEVVDRRSIASIMAWELSLEGVSAAFLGPPCVGFLAQYCFGYQATKQTVVLMPEAVRQTNSAALTGAMVWMMVMPWVLCFCAYSFLHVYYPKDRRVIMESNSTQNSEGSRLLPKSVKVAV